MPARFNTGIESGPGLEFETAGEDSGLPRGNCHERNQTFHVHRVCSLMDRPAESCVVGTGRRHPAALRGDQVRDGAEHSAVETV